MSIREEERGPYQKSPSSDTIQVGEGGRPSLLSWERGWEGIDRRMRAYSDGRGDEQAVNPG